MQVLRHLATARGVSLHTYFSDILPVGGRKEGSEGAAVPFQAEADELEMGPDCRRAMMGVPAFLAAVALLIVLPTSAAGPRQLQTLDEITLASNAGPYQENSLLGVPSEVDTGESFGSGTKVNVCKFQLGDVNNWILKPYIQYTSVVAQAILETSGRGSFIAPAVGFLHYGPSCYLYDHVCNFNYQEPCNLRGDCQTNNTCFCTNGWKTCVPNDGTVTSASAGCETYVYGDPNNCGECGNVCQSGQVCSGLGSCVASSTPSPPPPPPSTNTPPSPSGGTSPSGSPSPSSGSPSPFLGSPSPFPTGNAPGGGTGLQTPGSGSTTGVGTPGVGNPGSSGSGPSSSSATGPPSTGASGSSIAGPSQTGSVPSGSNVPANSLPTTGEAPGSSNSPDTGGSILGSTPASSRTHGIAAAGKGAAAEGTRTAAAGTGAASSAPAAISNSGDVVPGSTAKEAARKAARQAADASAAAGRRLLDLVQRL